MAKAKDAFRTISEVADWLDTPTHVLRFWESKFSQIKPVKGAGGRRYYRPSDMDLLGGIKQLLHEDGLTIKGTQKLLREKGIKHVSGLGQSMTVETDVETPAPTPAATAPEPAQGVVQDALPFDEPAEQPNDFVIDLPLPPSALPAAAPRLIGRAPVDASGLYTRAAQIAPLLARLSAVRIRMGV